MKQEQKAKAIVRHAETARSEPSACGMRHRLISREDSDVAAWAHTVDLQDGALHHHKISTELYYVLEGEGTILLDDETQPLKPGSLVHIPPGVVHAARGRFKALIIGIPDISDADVYFSDSDGKAT